MPRSRVAKSKPNKNAPPYVPTLNLIPVEHLTLPPPAFFHNTRFKYSDIPHVSNTHEVTYHKLKAEVDGLTKTKKLEIINSIIKANLMAMAPPEPVGQTLLSCYGSLGHEFRGYTFVCGSSNPDTQNLGAWLSVCYAPDGKRHLVPVTGPLSPYIIFTNPIAVAAVRIREETQRSSNPNSEASEALSTSPRNAIPLQPSSIANVAPAVSPATSPVPINRRARRSATATRPRSRKSKVRFLDEFPNASPPTPICAPVEEEFSDDDMELAHFLAELRAKRGKAMVSSLAAKAAKKAHERISAEAGASNSRRPSHAGPSHSRSRSIKTSPVIVISDSDKIISPTNRRLRAGKTPGPVINITDSENSPLHPANEKKRTFIDLTLADSDKENISPPDAPVVSEYSKYVDVKIYLFGMKMPIRIRLGVRLELLLVLNEHFNTLVKFGVDLNLNYLYLEKNDPLFRSSHWKKLDWLSPISIADMKDGDSFVIKQEGVLTEFDSDDATCFDPAA